MLDGAAGADQLNGGAGDDRYVIDDAADAVVEAAAEGTDTVFASVDATLAPNVEHLVLIGSAALAGTGNGEANVLVGNAGANALAAGAGNDVLAGALGDDRLDGGAGDDLYLYAQGEGRDSITDGSGVDTLRFGAGLTLDAARSTPSRRRRPNRACSSRCSARTVRRRSKASSSCSAQMAHRRSSASSSPTDASPRSTNCRSARAR